MRSEKGITLVSVIVYVIAMLIIILVITVLTSYFYKNVDINSTSENLSQQYTRFNTYFTEEVNKKGNNILDIGETESTTGNSPQKYIVFSSGNQYTFIPANKSIYINSVKIAEDIENCTFEEIKEDDKTKVKVTIQGANNFERVTTYTLVK